MFSYTEPTFKFIYTYIWVYNVCIIYIYIYGMTIDERLCGLKKGSKEIMREDNCKEKLKTNIMFSISYAEFNYVSIYVHMGVGHESKRRTIGLEKGDKQNQGQGARERDGCQISTRNNDICIQNIKIPLFDAHLKN